MNANQYFFAALIFDYLDFLKNIKGLSENTAKAYQRDLNKFSKFLESIYKQDIKKLLGKNQLDFENYLPKNKIYLTNSNFYLRD